MMRAETTHAGTFDDALGSWHVIGASTPDPSGVCWFWHMDRALKMYLLKRLVVTRWGRKDRDSLGIDAESRDARIRYRMKWAKKQEEGVRAQRKKLHKIGICWESWASTWLCKLAQTCRGWRDCVHEFRNNVGPGYMIDNALRLVQVQLAEQKLVARVRSMDRRNLIVRMIDTVCQGIMRWVDVDALKAGKVERKMVAMSGGDDILGWSLLDVWNHGGGKAFRKLAGRIRSDVEDAIGRRLVMCHVKMKFTPDGKDVPLSAKSCIISIWIQKMPDWRRPC